MIAGHARTSFNLHEDGAKRSVKFERKETHNIEMDERVKVSAE